MTGKIIAAAIALAGPLAGQQPASRDSGSHRMMGPMPMSPMMEGPMMQHMGLAMPNLMLYTPQHLLGRKDALALTATQVTRLTALQDGIRTAHDAAESEAKTHMQAMEQVANTATPDTAALKVHFQAAYAAMGKAHWAMLVSAAQARAVLTDAQRGTVQTWADSMRAWTEQHRRMMNPNRPP